MPVPRIVIMGAGFAGYNTARALERLLRPAKAEIVMVAPFGYTLYQPLLPQVAGGVLDPRAIAGPLHRLLGRTQLLPGKVRAADLHERTIDVEKIDGTKVTVRVPKYAHGVHP